MHSAPPQDTPHAPQFIGSDRTSAHEPLQPTKPPPHEVHAPLMHASLREHFVPHVPQLFWLVDVSTHSPLQSTVPVAHGTPELHALKKTEASNALVITGDE